MKSIPVEISDKWRDYELLDTGDGRKLESWGGYITIRPDPRIIWSKSNPALWEKADGVFKTIDEEEAWDFEVTPPKPWIITYDKLRFHLRPTDFKHVGVFPEQAANWEWIMEKLKGKSNQKVLNLFAYTGGSTQASVFGGAHVTHVDSSRPTMMWASDNAKLAGISKDRIRWIQDDALKFVKREIRRGVKYDGIIMDPPRFGRGFQGEVWKLLENLPELVAACTQILTEEPTFVLINAYTADMSSTVLQNLLTGFMKDRGGEVISGEMGLKESVGGRILPAGLFARWSSK